MPSLLEARNLTVAYGGIQAVKGAFFEINEGELVCFIGANGAGKSSLLKSLCGFPASITFTNYDLPRNRIRARSAGPPRGGEELEMGAYTRSDRRPRWKNHWAVPRLKEQLSNKQAPSPAASKNARDCRALMGQNYCWMNPAWGSRRSWCKNLRDDSRCVQSGNDDLLVEQNAKSLGQHRGYVMESGAITLSDAAAALAANPEVRRAYLGE